MTQERRLNLKDMLKDQLSQKKARNPSYSIRALARDIDIPYNAVSRLLALNTELNPKHKYKVGKFLKIPKADLLDFIFANNVDSN
jgi:hypothetical protein